MKKPLIYSLILLAAASLPLYQWFMDSKQPQSIQSSTSAKDWHVDYTLNKYPGEDWTLNEHVTYHGDKQVRFFDVSVHFKEPVDITARTTHDQPIEDNQMIIRLEGHRVFHSEGMGADDLMKLLDESYTLVKWTDGKGEKHSVKVPFQKPST
ncbi:hypothetical protein LCL89_09625 [Halobacillus yeomjeoni]|uniref:hypothetical protein n=1 Tax=Halobacillus yeomjeoni TaxID=311194 RepID=UPI001CD1AAC1|nr:hypothetical protein [Halobacillus yeomjeoni]MCA0984304.1 hypothetical protein [Halobacillus yeomjeoni]